MIPAVLMLLAHTAEGLVATEALGELVRKVQLDVVWIADRATEDLGKEMLPAEQVKKALIKLRDACVSAAVKLAIGAVLAHLGAA
jgi:hypothetical protein